MQIQNVVSVNEGHGLHTKLMRFTYCLQSLIVASPHPLIGVLHLLVDECVLSLAAVMIVEKMPARTSHLSHGGGLQGHLFPDTANSN